jgi:hypothetical protein
MGFGRRSKIINRSATILYFSLLGRSAVRASSVSHQATQKRGWTSIPSILGKMVLILIND